MEQLPWRFHSPKGAFTGTWRLLGRCPNRCVSHACSILATHQLCLCWCPANDPRPFGYCCLPNAQASDIRDLPVTNFSLLLLPVYKYVAKLRGYADADIGAPANLLAKLPPVTVMPSSTFAELVEKLVQT